MSEQPELVSPERLAEIKYIVASLNSIDSVAVEDIVFSDVPDLIFTIETLRAELDRLKDPKRFIGGGLTMIGDPPKGC